MFLCQSLFGPSVWRYRTYWGCRASNTSYKWNFIAQTWPLCLGFCLLWQDRNRKRLKKSRKKQLVDLFSVIINKLLSMSNLLIKLWNYLTRMRNMIYNQWLLNLFKLWSLLCYHLTLIRDCDVLFSAFHPKERVQSLRVLEREN